MSSNIFQAKRVVREFLSDKSGLAAVEFAYAAPLLLLMMFGTVEIGRAIQLDRKIDMITSATSDLVARTEDFGDNDADRDAEIEGIFNAIDHIMAPFDPSGLRLAIIPLARPLNASEPPEIYAGPFVHNDHPFSMAKCSTISNAGQIGAAGVDINSLVQPGGRVIVVRSQYEFEPLFNKPFLGLPFGIEPTRLLTTNEGGLAVWEDYAINSPRHNCNDFDNNNCAPCP